MALSGLLHTLVRTFQAVKAFPRILTTFWDLKVWPGSGSGFGSAWIHISLAPWIRIRIWISIDIKSWIPIRIDPHHCKNGYRYLYSSCYHHSFRFWPMFWIHDILVRIMIQILGSVHLITDPDPDPTFYLNANPDSGSQTNADKDSFTSQKVKFYMKNILYRKSKSITTKVQKPLWKAENQAYL